MSNKNFYITTTLPYVNSDPHVGFATEFVRADVVARAYKQKGYTVFFNTGTDEHGQKIYEKATSEGRDVQEYVDEYANRFRALIELLGIDPSVHFIRTTDPHHIEAAQEFWRRCHNNGYIYKKLYQAKYCVGCEMEKTDSELVNGECPLHPGRPIERIDEENYFFKFSSFQDRLLEYYATHQDFVTPDFRFREIAAFVERGLEDFSISRLASKMPWGIPVPDDADQVMYVWFDALVNYISTLGWPHDEKNFNDFWVEGTTVQYCGKDNLRPQTATWQAMLMAAGIIPTTRVVVNGFITGPGGMKMSKSLGNVVHPADVITEFGTDAFRYFVLRHVNAFEDSPFTVELVKEAYNAHLANGLGNIVSRLLTMSRNYEVHPNLDWNEDRGSFVDEHIESFNLNLALEEIWGRLRSIDQTIAERKPFSLFKTDPDQARSDVKDLLQVLLDCVFALRPFLPETAEKILSALKENKKPEVSLFIRKD